MKLKMKRMMFALGLVVAITSALLVAFVSTEELEFWPMVSGIVGISLIATLTCPPKTGPTIMLV